VYHVTWRKTRHFTSPSWRLSFPSLSIYLYFFLTAKHCFKWEPWRQLPGDANRTNLKIQTSTPWLSVIFWQCEFFVLKRSRMFWNVLKRFETFWNLMKRFETFWNLMKRSETLWKRFETFWNLMKLSETLWNLPKILIAKEPKKLRKNTLKKFFFLQIHFFRFLAVLALVFCRALVPHLRC